MTILWWHWLVLGLAWRSLSWRRPAVSICSSSAWERGRRRLAAFNLAGRSDATVALHRVSSVSLVFFRSRLLSAMQAEPQRPAIDTLVGEIGSAVDAMAPGSVGRVELRGTVWSGRNTAGAVVPAGARCRFVRVDGLLLLVEPEGR